MFAKFWGAQQLIVRTAAPARALKSGSGVTRSFAQDLASYAEVGGWVAGWVDGWASLRGRGLLVVFAGWRRGAVVWGGQGWVGDGAGGPREAGRSRHTCARWPGRRRGRGPMVAKCIGDSAPQFCNVERGLRDETTAPPRQIPSNTEGVARARDCLASGLETGILEWLSSLLRCSTSSATLLPHASPTHLPDLNPHTPWAWP